GDKKKIEVFIEKSKNQQKKAVAYKKLAEMIKFCENLQCRRKFLLEYFGEMHGGRCEKCDACLMPKETFDGTEIAKKIFVCIKDTNQRFGMNYIISVLIGKGKGDRILAYGHDNLGSYGTGNDYGTKQLQIFIRELVQLGFINVAGDKYPILKLSQKSFDVLSGMAHVTLAKPMEKIKDIKTTLQDDIQLHRALDHKLFELLRILRKNIADAENVPPYIIFPDFTLREMATFFPRSTESMLEIKGVGNIKLERYGRKFLEKINDYCNQNNVQDVRN
ncbi:MAG: RQC domain-containing protein, partial [Candidatus Aenigmatarchaeota archaeon]